jgi:hypothetical protein
LAYVILYQNLHWEIERIIEGTRRRGRRCKQVLDHLKEKVSAAVGDRTYWLTHPVKLALEEAVGQSHMQENIIGYFA